MAGEPGAGIADGPMPHRVLVVATAPDPSDELLEYLDKYNGDDLEVAVVAPASDISLLEWMAEDEDRARREAERRAREAAEAEALAAKVVDVEVGDPDPVLAVEDAFPRRSWSSSPGRSRRRHGSNGRSSRGSYSSSACRSLT